jgi:K+-transporting ATPase ATPase A chain
MKPALYTHFTFGLALLAGALLALVLRIRQAMRPRRQGTLPSDTPAFAALVVGTILVLGGLCFFPALALGPILKSLAH